MLKILGFVKTAQLSEMVTAVCPGLKPSRRKSTHRWTQGPGGRQRHKDVKCGPGTGVLAEVNQISIEKGSHNQ